MIFEKPMHADHPFPAVIQSTVAVESDTEAYPAGTNDCLLLPAFQKGSHIGMLTPAVDRVEIHIHFPKDTCVGKCGEIGSRREVARLAKAKQIGVCNADTCFPFENSDLF